MNCDDIHRLLHDYGTKRLAEELVQRFDRHVRDCQACQGHLERSSELTCREFVQFLDDYLAQELPAARRDVFEWHLKVCPDCTEYLASYDATLRASREAFTEPAERPPEDVPPDLLRAILDALRRDP